MVEDNENLNLQDVETILKNGGLSLGYEKVNKLLKTVSNSESKINILIKYFGMSRTSIINRLVPFNGDFYKMYTTDLKPIIDVFGIEQSDIEYIEKVLKG